MPARRARFTRKFSWTVGRWLLALLGAGVGYSGYVYVTLPDVRSLARSAPLSTAFIDLRARQAVAAGKTPRRMQRFVAYSRISADLKRAVLVAEDAAFWDHDGVDYGELQKSIELDWLRGQWIRGASTITQQLAKNLYFSPARNPIRKVQELIVARRLEAALTKTRIFELYLNFIEWGDGVYGVDAAARTYFAVSASALNAPQSAMLAGAIINPRVLNPAKPTMRLQRRQQLILARMGAAQPPENLAELPSHGGAATDGADPSSDSVAPRESSVP